MMPHPYGYRWRRGTTRHRWECRCAETPILLGIYSEDGEIEIKVRDRFYFLTAGCVQAICPRCGAEHLLDLRTMTNPNQPGERD
jgi:hypothetical protein